MNSMTGFGKSLKETEHYQIEVEIKSVNHRFLDIQLRLPRQLNSIEQAIRQTIKESLQRGRIELYLTLTEKGSNNKKAIIHWELLQQLINEIQQESNVRFQESAPSAARLLEKLLVNESFMEIKEIAADDSLLEQEVLSAIRQAIAALCLSRNQEGLGILQILKDNKVLLQQKTNELIHFVDKYEADYQQKFERKLQEYLGSQVDQERLLTEMAILLERGDIHEELDRLTLHLNNMNALLVSENPVGRELDFLIQEMNREVNTIGSKSSQIEIKNAVVQMKTILEKIREQIQNVE